MTDIEGAKVRSKFIFLIFWNFSLPEPRVLFFYEILRLIRFWTRRWV